MSNINSMVNRFLCWKLPKNFQPDGGISFNPIKPYEGDEHGNSWWPVGTNLLTADQARQMFVHVTADESLMSSQAALDVLAERRRQCEVENWTLAHDNEHNDGSLTMAAVCYAEWDHYEHSAIDEHSIPINWPWNEAWWKPTTPRQNLVKSAALILAEIERLDRIAAPNPETY